MILVKESKKWNHKPPPLPGIVLSTSPDLENIVTHRQLSQTARYN